VTVEGPDWEVGLVTGAYSPSEYSDEAVERRCAIYNDDEDVEEEEEVGVK
jgi:hypothetical protein